MKNTKQKLLSDQVNEKLMVYKAAVKLSPPQRGWVHAIRVALGMSLRQLGNKLQISPQSVKEIEDREQSGTITIKTLQEVAGAMNMKLVYGFVPIKGSIENTLEIQALEKAREIVLRTSQSMLLENQENSETRIKKAIKTKAEEIKTTLPRYLWD